MRLTLTCAALLFLSVAPAAAQPDCNRACLTGFVDTYFKALAANDPAAVPLAPNAKITSNGKVVRKNGLQTTGMVRNGAYDSAQEAFDRGRFIGRNIWDRRYPVVDTERGIVLSIVRFGMKDGMKSQNVATSNDRLVGEFFSVKNGRIQEVHAVLFNLPDAEPSVWPPEYGPGRGGK